MRRTTFWLALALLSPLGIRSLSAQESFALVGEGHAAQLIVSDVDHAGVVRAVGDLRADIERVSGIAPAVSNGAGAGERAPVIKQAVIVGTIGKSPLIDSLVARG